MLRYIFIFSIISCLSLSCGNKQSELKQVFQVLPAAEFRVRMQEFPSHQLIDVCTPDEFAEHRIPDAGNIDFYSSNFRETVAALDLGKPTFVYCYGGSRSKKAVAIMKELGFIKVYDLQGGLRSWMAEGNPVDSTEIR